MFLKMLNHFSLNLLIVGLLLELVSTELTQLPKTTETKIGEKTWLNCATNLSTAIHWSHGNRLVYAGGSLIDPYLSRFEIEPKVSEGSYNLVIPSVNVTDAGEYKCQDDEGLGNITSAELIALVDDPTCGSNVTLDQIIGTNDFGIEHDRILLACEVTFYGGIPPKMVWRKSGETNAITDGVEVETSGNKLKYLLTMMADDSFNNSSFTCETTRSVREQYGCTTEPIKILPACEKNPNVSMTLVGEEVVCSLNFFGQPCSYKWFNASNFTISNNETLKPDKVGMYRCEATCVMRNSSYTVVAMVTEVSSNKEAGDGQPLWIVPVVVVMLMMVVIIIIVVIVAIYCFKQAKRNRRKKSSTEAENGDLLLGGPSEVADNNGQFEVEKRELKTRKNESGEPQSDDIVDITPLTIADERNATAGVDSSGDSGKEEVLLGVGNSSLDLPLMTAPAASLSQEAPRPSAAATDCVRPNQNLPDSQLDVDAVGSPVGFQEPRLQEQQPNLISVQPSQVQSLTSNNTGQNTLASIHSTPTAAATVANCSDSNQGNFPQDGREIQKHNPSLPVQDTNNFAGPAQPPSRSNEQFQFFQDGNKEMTVFNISNLGPNVQIGNNNTMIVHSGGPNGAGGGQKGGKGVGKQKSSSKKETIIVPDEIVDLDTIRLVSNDIGKEWKQLGRELGMSHSDIDCYEIDNQFYGVKEMAYKMLCDWREKQAQGAKMDVLANALVAVKRHDIALKLSTRQQK